MNYVRQRIIDLENNAFGFDESEMNVEFEETLQNLENIRLEKIREEEKKRDDEIKKINDELVEQKSRLDVELGKLGELEKTLKTVDTIIQRAEINDRIDIIRENINILEKKIRITNEKITNTEKRIIYVPPVDPEKITVSPVNLRNKFINLFGTMSTPSAGKYGIDFNKMATSLEKLLTPDNIFRRIKSEKIIDFSTRIGMISVIEDVFNIDNNEKFDNFIYELYSLIFDHLKSTVQIEPTYEYFYNRKMIYWFLLAYIKRDILNGEVFYNEEKNVESEIREILFNPSYSVKIDVDKLRTRSIQYIDGNYEKICNFFENMVETAAGKKLHTENILYFFA